MLRGDPAQMKKTCELCPHRCELEEGQTGFCRARQNRDGQIISINYGKVTALALDPIEKKPLRHFYAGKNILSVGSFGCNLRCPYCQNHTISMANAAQTVSCYISPEELVARALERIPDGNIGIAYTYNEPLIGYEYVRDCAMLAKEKQLKNVVVTNGCIAEEAFQKLLPWIDAWNIDLKGFKNASYGQLCGDLEVVKRNIVSAAAQGHVEITTLIVPQRTDTEEEIRELSSWLSSVDCKIPLHITRFFPQYRMQDCLATPVSTVYRLADVARKYLEYVYEGNC